MAFLVDFLNETGIPYKKSKILFLSEDAKLHVSDNILTEMFKFITDKYNSLDFSEIEKSAGDFDKFKYRSLIDDNINILDKIYSTNITSGDSSVEVYKNTLQNIRLVERFLSENREQISYLYKKENGVIQLMYTTSVAAMMYSISALISNTIRFVTTEQMTDLQVLYDEMPSTVKNVHIKNIESVANDIVSYDKLVRTLYNEAKKPSKLHESASAVTAFGIGTMITVGLTVVLFRIVPIVREIVYSIFYSRVKLENVLELQISLIKTNIESLEAGRGNSRIIAKQKDVAKRLEGLKDKISVKFETGATMKNMQIRNENKKLDITNEPEYSGLLI